jgi:hypothetical protein
VTVTVRLQCPREHFIADVEVTDDGVVTARGRHGRHGIIPALYAPGQGIGRLHARCFATRCGYDGSMDPQVLCAELTAAAARGETRYKLTH